MKKDHSIQMLVASSLAILGFASLPSWVAAQHADHAMETIVVHAPFTVDRHPADASSSAATETNLVEVHAKVSFTDLDLSSPEGIAELDARIRAVAEDSCQQLAEAFPLDDSNIQSLKRCVDDAIADASQQKEKAIQLALE